VKTANDKKHVKQKTEVRNIPMSKFLKFIVHLVVVCTILCVVALAVPPFFGVTTVVMDDPDTPTNLPVGSVTYAVPVKTDEVTMGTKILVEEDGKTYRYNLVSLDTENRIGTVADPTVSTAETLTVAVKNYIPKVVITIGLIGYLQVATKSMEGLIILGLAVLFLVILYVIAELWKKDPEEDDYEEEEDEVYVKSKKELRREEKERQKRMDEDDRQLLRAEKERKKQERKKKKIIKTGGFVDEIYEDDLEPEEPGRRASQRATAQAAAASEAHEVLKKEIAATTAEADEKKPSAPRKKARPKPVKASLQSDDDNWEEELAEIKKMAIPSYSAAQLAERAKRSGDKPEVMQDEITKVTLFDYSDIIAEDDDDEE
jgi:hypothetical protein